MMTAYVENNPKKCNLLKKLAFTEVYNLDSNNQVTLLFLFFFYSYLFSFFYDAKEITCKNVALMIQKFW